VSVDDTYLPEEAVEGEGESVFSQDEADLLGTLVSRAYEKRQIRLSSEEESLISQRVLNDFNSGVGDNIEFQNLHVQLMKNWRATPEPKDFPYPNASNIKVPLTSFLVEQTAARLVKAILGDDLYARFSALDERVRPEELDALNKWFHYELSEVVKLETVLDTSFQSVCLDGFDLLVALYERKTGYVNQHYEVQIEDNQRLTVQMNTMLEDMFRDFEIGAVKQPQAGVFDVDLEKDGEKLNAVVRFSIESTRLVADVLLEDIVFDGVCVDSLPLERVVIVNTGPTVDELPFFGLQLWYDVLGFEDLCDGRYFRKLSKADIETVKAHGVNKRGNVVQRKWSDELDKAEGTETTGASLYRFDRKWVEVYRWEGRWEVDGRVQDVVVWYAAMSQKILSIQYLADLSPDGCRTPTKIDCIPVKGRFYSIGMAEWLRHVQAEMDGIHNQRLDAGIFANSPFFFYEAGAGLDKTVIQTEPGKGYPVKDVSKVLFPKVNWSPIWSFQEEELARRNAMDQAGYDDTSLGSLASKRMTASEVIGAAEATNLRTERLVRRTLLSLTSLIRRIFALYQRHLPDKRVYEVSGIDGTRVMQVLERRLLNSKVALHLTGDVRKISAQIERDVAMNMLSVLLNPLLLQIGVTKGDTIYKAVEKVVRAFDYKGVPIHMPDLPPDSLPPASEEALMYREEQVEPSPTENMQLHLAHHMRQLADPTLEQWTPIGRQLLMAHVQKTMQLQEVVQMMNQQRAAMAAQMRLSMEEQGVRPGKAGSQQVGGQAEGGSAEEGVEGAPAEGQALQ